MDARHLHVDARAVTRVAAVDGGTNSLRLLVADVDGDQVTEVIRRTEIVRLGQGVDRTGRLAPEALARTLAILREYADDIDRVGGVEHVAMVATSATRDAINRDEFVTGVESILTVTPQVITGAAEADLSFAGALSGLPATVPRPVLVVDVGGGSTELVLGASVPEGSTSVDIGAVRITERHFHTDPPTVSQVRSADDQIASSLDAATPAVDLAAARSVVGLGGTITTLGAMYHRSDTYDRSVVHLTEIPAGDIRSLSTTLLTATRPEREAIPVIHPGRVDVIAAGALITRHVLDRSGAAAVVVSEHDILDGIAVSIA